MSGRVAAGVRRGRSLPGDARLMLFAAAVALLTIVTLAPTEVRPRPTSVLEQAALADDDGGRALFSRAELAPARPVSRCLVVTHRGPAAGEVWLAAAEVAGELADSLRIRVEVGDGGGWDGCDGFAGVVFYDGVLSRLAAVSAADGSGAAGSGADGGVPTGWRPGPDGRRTFRITATVVGGNEAQGRRVTATLQWRLAVDESRPPGDGALGLVDPTDPTPPASDPSSASPTPSSLPSSSPPAPSGADEAWRVVRGVAIRMLRHGGLPLGSLIAMLLFLLIQRRLDDRDPKLALAPMSDNPYLYFDRPVGGMPTMEGR